MNKECSFILRSLFLTFIVSFNLPYSFSQEDSKSKINISGKFQLKKQTVPFLQFPSSEDEQSKTSEKNYKKLLKDSKCFQLTEKKFSSFYQKNLPQSSKGLKSRIPLSLDLELDFNADKDVNKLSDVNLNQVTIIFNLRQKDQLLPFAQMKTKMNLAQGQCIGDNDNLEFTLTAHLFDVQKNFQKIINEQGLGIEGMAKDALPKQESKVADDARKEQEKRRNTEEKAVRTPAVIAE